jgi:hypothetical protein
MATIDTSGKLAYMYDEGTDTWYVVSGAINTAAAYTWQNTNTYQNTVIFEDVVRAEAGINNFQNPTARDAAITAPINGIVCFVRQDDLGTQINQIQYYYNGVWRYVGDGSQIVTKIDNYTLAYDDAGKAIIVNSASDRIVTIPANASVPFAIGQRIDIIRYGTGAVTISPDTGVILYSDDDQSGARDLGGRYAGATIIKTASDTWVAIGKFA